MTTLGISVRLGQMAMRISPASLVALLVAMAFVPLTWGQDSEDLKRGVVRITVQADGKRKVGTGFLVCLDQNAAFVETAAQVVEGDPRPQVTFFPEPGRAFAGEVGGAEGANPSGLAALLVEGQLPAGLRVLVLELTLRVSGGEPVVVIGFPTTFGTPRSVTTGTISGFRGRNLIFSAPVEEGDSGGPLLLNGKVVGISPS